jgi:hypothetical protein
MTSEHRLDRLKEIVRDEKGVCSTEELLVPKELSGVKRIFQ